MKTITPKLTFAQAIAQQDAAKNNSDLANLASAMLSIQQQKRELEELEIEIKGLAAAIESGNVIPVDKVKKLYDRATRHGKAL